MPDDFVGRRGARDYEWDWQSGAGQGRSPRGRRSRARLILILGLAVLSVLLAAGVFLLARDGSDDGHVKLFNVTPTAGLTSATSLPAPSQASFLFAAWNARSNKWQSTDLNADNSSYSEGQEIPFLVRIDGAARDSNYDVILDYYDCSVPPAMAFDYLTSAESAGELPLLAAPAPGRVRPDSAISIPRDPGVTLKRPPEAASFSLWGGSFYDAPSWVSRSSLCPDGRRMSLKLRAQGPVVFLAWSAHIASSADWPGQGAARATATYGISVELPSLGRRVFTVMPGAVAPIPPPTP